MYMGTYRNLCILLVYRIQDPMIHARELSTVLDQLDHLDEAKRHLAAARLHQIAAARPTLTLILDCGGLPAIADAVHTEQSALFSAPLSQTTTRALYRLVTVMWMVVCETSHSHRLLHQLHVLELGRRAFVPEALKLLRKIVDAVSSSSVPMLRKVASRLAMLVLAVVNTILMLEEGHQWLQSYTEQLQRPQARKFTFAPAAGPMCVKVLKEPAAPPPVVTTSGRHERCDESLWTRVEILKQQEHEPLAGQDHCRGNNRDSDTNGHSLWRWLSYSRKGSKKDLPPGAVKALLGCLRMCQKNEKEWGQDDTQERQQQPEQEISSSSIDSSIGSNSEELQSKDGDGACANAGLSAIRLLLIPLCKAYAQVHMSVYDGAGKQKSVTQTAWRRRLQKLVRIHLGCGTIQVCVKLLRILLRPYLEMHLHSTSQNKSSTETEMGCSNGEPETFVIYPVNENQESDNQKHTQIETDRFEHLSTYSSLPLPIPLPVSSHHAQLPEGLQPPSVDICFSKLRSSTPTAPDPDPASAAIDTEWRIEIAVGLLQLLLVLLHSPPLLRATHENEANDWRIPDVDVLLQAVGDRKVGDLEGLRQKLRGRGGEATETTTAGRAGENVWGGEGGLEAFAEGLKEVIQCKGLVHAPLRYLALALLKIMFRPLGRRWRQKADNMKVLTLIYKVFPPRAQDTWLLTPAPLKSTSSALSRRSSFSRPRSRIGLPAGVPSSVV